MEIIFSITLALFSVNCVYCDLRVKFKSFHAGSGEYNDQQITCAMEYISPRYSGFEQDISTGLCSGLGRKWVTGPQISADSQYMVKMSTHDVYKPPLKVTNGKRYVSRIPGVLSTNATLQYVIQEVGNLTRFVILLAKRSPTIAATFKMRFSREYAFPEIKFCHLINHTTIEADTVTHSFSFDTPTLIEFVILESVIQVNVGGLHFYDWIHRYPVAEFAWTIIYLPSAFNESLDMHRMSVIFPEM